MPPDGKRSPSARSIQNFSQHQWLSIFVGTVGRLLCDPGRGMENQPGWVETTVVGTVVCCVDKIVVGWVVVAVAVPVTLTVDAENVSLAQDSFE